jgi:hypothetical protein
MGTYFCCKYCDAENKGSPPNCGCIGKNIDKNLTKIIGYKIKSCALKTTEDGDIITIELIDNDNKIITACFSNESLQGNKSELFSISE